MRLASSRAHNVLDCNATHLQSVAYKRTVTAPRHCLGAHDGDLFLVRGIDERRESRFELGRLHVIGVAPKRCIAPSRVRRVLSGVTQSAQLRYVCIPDAGLSQRLRQSLAIELRIRPRAWDRPHVHQSFHSMGAQHFDKGLDASGRMSDRQDFR